MYGYCTVLAYSVYGTSLVGCTLLVGVRCLLSACRTRCSPCPECKCIFVQYASGGRRVASARTSRLRPCGQLLGSNRLLRCGLRAPRVAAERANLLTSLRTDLDVAGERCTCDAFASDFDSFHDTPTRFAHHQLHQLQFCALYFVF